MHAGILLINRSFPASRRWFSFAKPSADIVQEINPDIAEEIQEYNRQSENRRTRKTYFTGDEREISLMALDLDNYMDIIVNKMEYTLTGNKNYTSEMATGYLVREHQDYHEAFYI